MENPIERNALLTDLCTKLNANTNARLLAYITSHCLPSKRSASVCLVPFCNFRVARHLVVHALQVIERVHDGVRSVTFA